MTPVLGYWKLRGLCQHIKYLLEYVGADYQEKQYLPKDSEEWVKEKFNLGLDFPNLPYYIDKDVKLTQSLAILKYIANKYGLAGNKDNTHLFHMVECHLMDIRIKQALLYLDPKCNKNFPEFTKNTQPIALRMLSNFLGDKNWLFETISYVDFLLYEVLCVAVHFDAKSLDDFPSLNQFKVRFENLDAIKSYISSSRHIEAPFHWPFVKRDD